MRKHRAQARRVSSNHNKPWIGSLSSCSCKRCALQSMLPALMGPCRVEHHVGTAQILDKMSFVIPPTCNWSSPPAVRPTQWQDCVGEWGHAQGHCGHPCPPGLSPPGSVTCRRSTPGFTVAALSAPEAEGSAKICEDVSSATAFILRFCWPFPLPLTLNQQSLTVWPVRKDRALVFFPVAWVVSFPSCRPSRLSRLFLCLPSGRPGSYSFAFPNLLPTSVASRLWLSAVLL